jgi:hypothetical protein
LDFFEIAKGGLYKMKVERNSLKELEDAYATGLIDLGGESCLLVGPETRGRPLKFTSPDWTDGEPILDELGGCMNVRSFSQIEDGFLAIEGFYPVFQSEGAGVVLARRDSRGNWRKQRILDLPFVHRIEEIKVEDESFLVASTLAAAKDSPEDWSRSGATYVGKIPEEPYEDMEVEEVLSGIHKNHGLHVQEINGSRVILITGQEGIFSISVPSSASGDWDTNKLVDHEVSDISMADLDKDGELEFVTIEPFHGDTLGLYKRKDGTWERQSSYPLNFGHVVWAGELLGEPRVIAGSRDGEAELTCLKVAEDSLELEEDFVLDRGVGPAQISVLSLPDSDIVFSANNGADEVAMYRIDE